MYFFKKLTVFALMFTLPIVVYGSISPSHAIRGDSTETTIVTNIDVGDNNYLTSERLIDDPFDTEHPSKSPTVTEDIYNALAPYHLITGNLKDYMKKNLPGCYKTATILALGGGGTRGIFTAEVIKQLEDNIGKPISEAFHLIAGTSTGSIQAAAYASMDSYRHPRYSAKEVAEIYELYAGKIFPDSIWSSARKLINCKYDNKPLRTVLKEYFGDSRLSQLGNDVLIPYYDITNNHINILKSYAAQHRKEKDALVRDAVATSSAAPTYFEPYRLANVKNRSDIDSSDSDVGEVGVHYVNGIDGGVLANNPALCALTEAAKIYPFADSFFILSLETGDFREQNTNPSGLLSWASAMPDFFMQSASDMVKYQIRNTGNLYGKPVIYCGIQINLSEDHSLTDGTDPEHLRYLASRAYDLDIIGKINSISSFLAEPKIARSEIIYRRGLTESDLRKIEQEARNSYSYRLNNLFEIMGTQDAAKRMDAKYQHSIEHVQAGQPDVNLY